MKAFVIEWVPNEDASYGARSKFVLDCGGCVWTAETTKHTKVTEVWWDAK